MDVMLSHRRTVMTGGALRAAIAAAIVALTVAGCENISSPDPSVCKAALQAEYLKAAAGQGHFGAEPSACKGLPKAEVQRFIQQVQAGR